MSCLVVIKLLHSTSTFRAHCFQRSALRSSVYMYVTPVAFDVSKQVLIPKPIAFGMLLLLDSFTRPHRTSIHSLILQHSLSHIPHCTLQHGSHFGRSMDSGLVYLPPACGSLHMNVAIKPSQSRKRLTTRLAGSCIPRMYF